jgi:signal transduction histidine kinase
LTTATLIGANCTSIRTAGSDRRRKPARLEPLLLEQIVREAVHAERRPDAAITIDVRPGLKVSADPRHLKRAIGNALRNAIEHAGSAGPILITGRQVGDRVEIAIADSGPGVPGEALERIFAPFFRLDPSRDRKTGGAGQGLAIVRISVEACRGTVTCAKSYAVRAAGHDDRTRRLIDKRPLSSSPSTFSLGRM